MKWKYKSEIEDPNVFSEYAKARRIRFPEELKEFIIEHNGATPEKYHVKIGEQERIFGSVLSFNKFDDSDSVYEAMEVIHDRNLIPFGDYFCYDLKDTTIVFWDHESEDGSVARSGKTLTAFLKSLY